MQKLKLTLLSQFVESDIDSIYGVSDDPSSEVPFSKDSSGVWTLTGFTFHLAKLSLRNSNGAELAYTSVDIYNNNVDTINLTVELNVSYAVAEGYGIDISITYGPHESDPNYPIPTDENRIGKHLNQGLLENDLIRAKGYMDPVTELNFGDSKSAQFDVITSNLPDVNEFGIPNSSDYVLLKDLSGIETNVKIRRTYPILNNSNFNTIAFISGIDYSQYVMKCKCSSDPVFGLFKYFISNSYNYHRIFIYDKTGVSMYEIGDEIDSDLYPNEILRIYDNLILQSGKDLILIKAISEDTSTSLKKYTCTTLKLENYVMARCSDIGHCIFNLTDMTCRNPFEITNNEPAVIDVDNYKLDQTEFNFSTSKPTNFYFDFLNSNVQLIKVQTIKAFNAIKFIKEYENVSDMHLFDEIATYIVGDLLYWISYSDYDQIIDYTDTSSGYGLNKKFGRIDLNRNINGTSFTKSDIVYINVDGLKVQILYSNGTKFYEVIDNLVNNTSDVITHWSLNDLWNKSGDYYRGIIKRREI